MVKPTVITGDIHRVKGRTLPPLPAVAGLIRVLLQYALPNASNVLNRLFFQGSGSTSNTALNAWTLNIANNWNTNMAPQLVPACQLVAVTAEDLSSLTSPIGAWSGSHAGTSTHVDSVDPGSALIVKNLTALRSRGGHSRNYLPGIPDSNVSAELGSQWNAASAGGIITSWKAFLAAISGANGPTGYPSITQVVPNYYHGFTVVTNPITHRARNVPTPLATPNIYPVSTQTFNPIIGAQRRRNRQTS